MLRQPYISRVTRSVDEIIKEHHCLLRVNDYENKDCRFL